MESGKANNLTKGETKNADICAVSMYRLADLDAFIMANRYSNEAAMGGANV